MFHEGGIGTACRPAQTVCEGDLLGAVPVLLRQMDRVGSLAAMGTALHGPRNPDFIVHAFAT